MAKVVIIGGGLTGLSCAYHLEQSGFHDYEIFEQEHEVGGLCRSVKQQGFTFDYTGHVLHLKDPYVAQLIHTISDHNKYTNIARRSYIYSHDRYSQYPFQTNLYGLPQEVITDCIEGFIKRKKSLRTPQTFSDWVLKHFGRGIGKHFLFPYNKKLWCTNAHQMLHTWTGRFVPKTSLRQMIHGALTQTQNNIGYNAQFLYPSAGGISYLPQQLARALHKKVLTNYSARTINVKDKTIRFDNGDSRSYDILVSTLPLNNMIGMLNERSSSSLSHAQKKLICTSLINFNLGLNKKDISDKHWIYFPEKKFSFYRIGFWHNFTPSAVPNNCSALYGEFTYLPGSKTQTQLNNMTRKAIAQTQELFNFSSRDVCITKVLQLKHAYVVYDRWRETHIKTILENLEKESLYSVGRFGSWKYSSMQDAILDGKYTAEQILTRNEKTYHPALKINNKKAPLSQQKTTTEKQKQFPEV